MEYGIGEWGVQGVKCGVWSVKCGRRGVCGV